MEPFRTDSSKLAEMIMCGDHPSFTSKAELNAKECEAKECEAKEKAKEKERRYPPYRLTPTSSRIAALPSSSEHEMKLTRPPPPATRSQQTHILRAASLRSARWAPYQLLGWAMLLLAAHALAGLVELLERGLPPLRSLCEYLTEMTCSFWRSRDRHHMYASAALGGAAGALWAAYGALRTARALALWAVLPMADGPADASAPNALQEADSRLNASIER